MAELIAFSRPQSGVKHHVIGASRYRIVPRPDMVLVAAGGSIAPAAPVKRSSRALLSRRADDATGADQDVAVTAPTSAEPTSLTLNVWIR